MLIKNISVVIIVKNSEASIAKTLDSLVNFKEVIIYDNGSTDKTMDIVNSYKNIKLVEGEFKGFGWSKNKAASFASNEWVFSLDSDEVLSDKFIKELELVKLDKKNIYTINRINFYKDKQVKYCWNHDIIVRLYNKNITTYTDAHVHENIIEDGLQRVLLQGEV